MNWSRLVDGQPRVPRVIGADISPYPYISGYGLVQRISAFALPTGSELAALGLKNRKYLDVLAATQRPGRAQSALVCALGLQTTGVALYWSPDTWSPMDCPGLFNRYQRPLRQCWECASHGYHNALFQLPSISRCPWHGAALTTACPECGANQLARFNKLNQLGHCACGFTALNARIGLAEMRSFPYFQCAQWCEDYLEWVGQRQRRLLYVPESNLHWDDAYAALAKPPAILMPPEDGQCSTPAPMLSFEGVGADPAPDCLWGWSHLGGQQGFRSAPLPKYVIQKLASITSDVLADLSGNEQVTRSDGESGVMPTQDDQTYSGHPYLIAPYGISEGDKAWISLAAVDKEVTVACGGALAHFAWRIVGTTNPFLSPQTGVGMSLGSMTGRRHLVDAMIVCLCRAYSQGLSTMLRHSESRIEADEVGLEVPLFEVSVLAGAITSVRVAWAPSPSARRTPTLPDLPAPLEESR